MKPIWKGTLRLESLQIPIKLYTTVNTRSLTLNTFHAVCLNRLTHEKKCPVHGSVPAQEIISAFALSENEYLRFDEDELKQIRLDSQDFLDVIEFIDVARFDPLLIAKTYFLTPDGPEAKRYYVGLRRALQAQQKVGITRILLNRKEYVAAVWYWSRVLRLSLLYYKNELHRTDTFDELKELPRPRQRMVQEMGVWIEDRTRNMRLGKYRDRFLKQFERLIQQKVATTPTAIFVAPGKSLPERKTVSKMTDTETWSETGAA
jgi:DNA end-binding protein Ku